MIDTNILTDIGLTKNEAELYVILVKSGQLTATEIAGQTKISRPHVYDSLSKLLTKGAVNYVIKNNKKYFKADNPQKLLEYFREKCSRLESAVPELEKYLSVKKNDTKINIMEGPEGLKTVMNDMIRTGKEIVTFGASDRVYEHLPKFVIDKYLEERRKKKIAARQFYYEGTKVLKSPYSEFRKLPKEFSTPTTTLVYGNKISIWIWQPVPMAIMIESDDLAKAYRHYFELLWKIAKIA